MELASFRILYRSRYPEISEKHGFSLSQYWDELEDDYERREKAIEWMKNLPAGKEGTIAFLNGVRAEGDPA